MIQALILSILAAIIVPAILRFATMSIRDSLHFTREELTHYLIALVIFGPLVLISILA